MSPDSRGLWSWGRVPGGGWSKPTVRRTASWTHHGDGIKVLFAEAIQATEGSSPVCGVGVLGALVCEQACVPQGAEDRAFSHTGWLEEEGGRGGQSPALPGTSLRGSRRGTVSRQPGQLVGQCGLREGNNQVNLEFKEEGSAGQSQTRTMDLREDRLRISPRQ